MRQGPFLEAEEPESGTESLTARAGEAWGIRRQNIKVSAHIC